MGYHDRLNQVEEIRQRILRMGKLPEDAIKRLNYRFRLDMNYHSNRMEGGTLTVAETKSVMTGVISVDGKPVRDVLEMLGHDQIVQDMLAMGKGEKRISEKQIRNIHRAIIKPDEENPLEMPGEWKKQPNEIITYRNEKVDFAAPGDVPELVHQLINRVNAQLEVLEKGAADARHVLLVASDFQVDFLTIHPFWDGNGRTARILSNLILVSHGYPPVVVPQEEKQTYGQLLSDIQTFKGDRGGFYGFMANRLLHSMELVERAVNGKDISDDDDLDKRLQLMDLELNAVDPENELRETLNYEYITRVLDGWAGELLSALILTTQKFNRYYIDPNHAITIINTNGGARFIDEPPSQVLDTLRGRFAEDKERRLPHQCELQFSVNFGKFKKGGLKTFGCNYYIQIHFDELKYRIEMDLIQPHSSGKPRIDLYTKLLHQPLAQGEIKEIDKAFGNLLYAHLDLYTKKANLR